MNLVNKLTNKKILVIGGTGFIGSNLIEYLNKTTQCHITVTGRTLPAETNLIKSDKSSILYSIGDVGDLEFIKSIIQHQDLIFYLAGHSGLATIFNDPLNDLMENCKNSLQFLECCKILKVSSNILIVGSQLELAHFPTVNSTSDVSLNKLSFYGAHRLLVSYYASIYHQAYGMNIAYLRLPNVYGYSSSYRNYSQYNLVNHFFQQAYRGKELVIYGTGKAMRDYLYVDDAISAMLLAIQNPQAYGVPLSIGTGKGTSIIAMAEEIVASFGRGSVTKKPWPNDYCLMLDVYNSDYTVDSSNAKKILGWNSAINSISKGVSLVKARYFS